MAISTHSDRRPGQAGNSPDAMDAPVVMANRQGIQRLAQNEDGSVAVIAAMTLLVIFTLAGGGIDYGRAVTVRDQLQQAVDSSALAAARVWQTEKDIGLAETKGLEYFNRNKPRLVDNAVATFTPDLNRNAMVIEAQATVATPFLSLVRTQGYPVFARAEAMLAVGGNAQTNLELSLMLDVTGSMSGQKIDDLKTAAKDLIDIVVWDDQSEYTSKVAITPFAPRVNVGSYAAQLTGLPATRVIGGTTKLLRKCLTERIGAQEFTDAAPGPGAYLRPYNGITDPSDSAYNSNWSSSGSCNDPNEEIVPLSADKTSLKARIDAFTAGGSTAGTVGTAWAWYLISPQWAGVWPAGSQPAAYGTANLQKFAILMTDGEYNTWGAGSMDSTTVSNKAKTLCTNMKATGITVYTIGFDLGGNATAVGTLRHCATDETKFYETSSGDELRQAFRDIALQIAKLRLSQ